MRRIGRSFLTKIVAVSILLITIPFTLAAVVSYHIFQRYIERTTVNSATQIVRQLEISLDSYFTDIDQLTLMPFYNQQILAVLKGHSDPIARNYVTSAEQEVVSRYCSSILYDRPEIKNTLFFTRDGNILSNQIMGTNQLWNEKDAAWMRMVAARPGEFVILPPQTCHYYRDEREVKFLSAARLLRSPFYLKPLGFIKIDLNTRVFQSILSGVQFTPHSQLFIFNQDRQLIFPDRARSVPKMKDGRVVQDGAKYISKTAYSKQSRLAVIALISINDLQRDTMGMLSLVIIIVLVALLLAYCGAVGASFRLARPILELKEKMLQVGEGKLDVRAAVRSDDEIGQLAQMFNEMVVRLDYLVNEVYRATISEKEAEISALQSQINPHFMYNTLETINMMAVAAGNLPISAAVSSLGKLLRYCVANERKLVKLQEELAFIKTYFSIQSMRHERLKTLEIEILPELTDYYIPKLILQPFIENVIEHARDEAEIIIKISVTLDRDTLRIGIYDNGGGVDAVAREKIKQLLDGVNRADDVGQMKDKQKGYGLSNVQKRVKLLYGDTYGIAFDEEYTDGAGFIIRLKAQLNP